MRRTRTSTKGGTTALWNDMRRQRPQYKDVTAGISAKKAQGERLADFIRILVAQDGTIKEFDESLWGSMVDFVTVCRDKEITVTFRDGSEIQA